MAAFLLTTITTLVLFSRRALAGNFTTSILLPNGLFWEGPQLQTFLAQSAVTGLVTSYTLNCGDGSEAFWPGPYGCDDNNSYSFVGNQINTQFLMPE